MPHHSAILGVVTGVMALLLAAVAVRALTERIKFPFTVALTLTGMTLTAAADSYPAVARLTGSMTISPDVVLYVFLPTLIFEAAYNLDARLLMTNLTPVMTLAAPGLILSTAVIGAIVSYGLGVPAPEALLLGAILSATDPVAVVALFKQLGVSRSLSTLVEGESLFNDATSIVLSRLLVGVVAAGVALDGGTALQGGIDFVVMFLGGIMVGWGLALGAARIIGTVEADAPIEITLTTALAYTSFLVAEELFHVSGVMATVTAGIVIGGREATKISPAIRKYLDSFWEYLAFVANALIFLLVGLHVKMSALMAEWEGLLWVVAAMLASRAAVVYGLTPLAGMTPGAPVVDRKFQTVIFWGGLRGAVALAIVLSLPTFPNADRFVTLVTGAVLFTLLVQGLTVEGLIHALGLDVPPLADRFARLEARIAALTHARRRAPELVDSGFFSASVGARLVDEVDADLAALADELARLRADELTPDAERRLLVLFGLSEEKSFARELFAKGHLTEEAYHELALNLDVQIDAVRHGAEAATVDYHHLRRRRLAKWLVATMDRIAPLAEWAQRAHRRRIAQDYEAAWARRHGALRVMDELDTYAADRAFDATMVAAIRGRYEAWGKRAAAILDEYAAETPAFVAAMQERLGRRLMALAEEETVVEQDRRGALPHGVAEEAEREIRHRLRRLRGVATTALSVTPDELLRKIRWFAEVDPGEFAVLTASMRERAFAERETVIRQGEKGEALYLIVRGVARVSRLDDAGTDIALATLMAGDFFGEHALLSDEPRNATVTAVTPCALYELRRADVHTLMAEHPTIRAAIEDAEARRG